MTKISFINQFVILLRYTLLQSKNTIRVVLKQNKLTFFILFLFLFCYLVISFLLLRKGLNVIYSIPIIGNVISERMLYMASMCIFVMLMMSNLITSYSSLYADREINWLFTLPISTRVIYLWKLTQTLVFSSWGLLLLGFPILLAYGTIFESSIWFYLMSILVYFPFVSLTASLASWILALLIYFFNKYLFIILIAVVFIFTFKTYDSFKQSRKESDKGTESIILATDQALKHTRFSIHPMSPTTWSVDYLLLLWRGLPSSAFFKFFLLLSNTFFAIWLTILLFSRIYYSSWIKHVLKSNRRVSNQLKIKSFLNKFFLFRFLSINYFLFFLSKPIRAIVRKDIISFLRSPSQWIQIFFVYFLISIYVINLQNMGYGNSNEFWRVVISYLNLFACSFAVATLTTRFVFPQFSLEGIRLWLLDLCPVSLRKVLLVKYFQNLFLTCILTCPLIVFSSYLLNLEDDLLGYFLIIIFILNISLNSISMGFGIRFAKLKEVNPSKIVSSFGGTLSLIISFLFLFSSLFVFTLPALINNFFKNYMLVMLNINFYKISVCIGVSMSFLALVFSYYIANSFLKTKSFGLFK